MGDVLAGSGTTTGTSNTWAATACTAGFCAAPPISRMRSATPSARTASRPSARPQSIPSIAARARLRRVVDARVMPVSVAVASGRFGVRSPSKYGHEHHAVRARARRRARGRPSPAWSTPSSAGDRVEHAGRVEGGDEREGPPAASAKPATVPVASRVGRVGDREDGAAGADGDHHVARGRAQAERGAGVVARAGTDDQRAGRRRSAATADSPAPSTPAAATSASSARDRDARGPPSRSRS